jgi:hypothetical protein
MATRMHTQRDGDRHDSRKEHTGHPRNIRPVDYGNDGNERGQQPRQAGGYDQPDLEDGGGRCQLLPINIPCPSQTDVMTEIHHVHVFPIAKMAVVQVRHDLSPFQPWRWARTDRAAGPGGTQISGQSTVRSV